MGTSSDKIKHNNDSKNYQNINNNSKISKNKYNLNSSEVQIL